ncbi:hypothetical protein TSOC_000376, partial [Tetrabaena socialis]
LLAPTDAAFEQLLRQLGNGRKLPVEKLYRLPELPDILQYHILPGLYASGSFYNNTPVWTARGVEVIPFNDPCMTEGAIKLHDNCIDKPTPDNFTCAEQAAFDKCFFPFMTSALAAQWQGGFCQRTCERCSCALGSGVQCATIVAADSFATNGVLHAISRVLFPPPKFSKSDYNASQMVNITAVMKPGTAAPAGAPAPLPGKPAPALVPPAVAGTPTPAPAATASAAFTAAALAAAAQPAPEPVPVPEPEPEPEPEPVAVGQTK